MSLTKITSEGIADGSIVNADLHSGAAIAHSKLANSGVTAGSYGSATAIPALTINAQGLVTAASTNTVNTTTNLGISTATDSVTVTSSTGNNAQISEASGSAAGVMSVAHHDKLDGIEASATADQTASEIVALIADQTIAPSLLTADKATFTDDGSASPIVHIKADDSAPFGLIIGNDSYSNDAVTGLKWYVANNGNCVHEIAGASDFVEYTFKSSNQSTGHTLLKATTLRAVELYFQNVKRFETVNGGVSVTGNISVSGTVDGIDIATDVAANTAKVTNATHTGDVTGSTSLTIANNAVSNAKLADMQNSRIIGRVSSGTGDPEYLTASSVRSMINVEDGATADQSAAEIRSLVESASDSNVFTDADHSKLNGIEASATADQTASEILTLIKTVDGSGSGLDADLLDGNSSSHYLNYNNLSNKPSIPSAVTNNNQLTNGAGYMSGSTSQLVKAFVNYNGNNNSIRNDYNVSSITDHANGDQTVNFSSSISMSYTVSGMPIGHDHLGARCTNCIRGSSSSGPTRMNSTGVRIMRGFGSHNARQDGHTMCVAIHRP